MDWLSTFLMAFSTLVLKLYFSQSLPAHSHLSLAEADFLEFDHSVLGGNSVGKSGRLRPPSWLFGAL